MKTATIKRKLRMARGPMEVRLASVLKEAVCMEEWAQKELDLAGWFDDSEDSLYGGMVGEAVMEMVKVFSGQGHSGMSAGLINALLNKVLQYEPLSPLGNPGESGDYTDTSEYWGPGETGRFQSTRDFSVFSDDAGKSWYKSVDDRYDELHIEPDEEFYGMYVENTQGRKVPLSIFESGKDVGHDRRKGEKWWRDAYPDVPPYKDDL